MKIDYDPLAQDKESAMHAQHKSPHIKAQMAVVKGLTLFELNEKTRVVRPADYTKTFDINKNEYVMTVVMNPGCTYRQFLNIQNAIKKFDKYI